MPIAVLTLPGVIRVGAAVSSTCPRMCLTEVLPYEPVIADHGRLELVEPGAGLVPVAALHPRLGRREQQIGGDQGQRNELHRDDPDDDKLADQRRGDPDQRRERPARSRKSAWRARSSPASFSPSCADRARTPPRRNRPARPARRRAASGTSASRISCAAKIASRISDSRRSQPRFSPIHAQKAPDVVLLLLKQVQIGQQPAGRENGEAEHGEQDGQGGHAICSTNSDEALHDLVASVGQNAPVVEPAQDDQPRLRHQPVEPGADLGRGLAVPVAVDQHRRAARPRARPRSNPRRPP